MSDSSGPGFRLGRREFGFTILDSRDRYRRPALDVRFAGQLHLDPLIADAVPRFGRLASTFPGELTLYDGNRLVLSEPPVLTGCHPRDADRVLRLRFKRTSYFAGALCRQLASPEFASHVNSHWPPGAPTVAAIRERVSGGPGFHPLQHPGAGVSIYPVAADRSGEPWTVLHRRGGSLAVNPGIWSAGIEESLGLPDISADGQIDPWAAARRGATEELGTELTRVDLFGFGLDPAVTRDGAPSTSCGYVFSGWATVPVLPDKLRALSSGSCDAFETGGSTVVELTAPGVARALSAIDPRHICGPAVYGLIGTLDRLRPGASATAAGLLSSAWS